MRCAVLKGREDMSLPAAYLLAPSHDASRIPKFAAANFRGDHRARRRPGRLGRQGSKAGGLWSRQGRSDVRRAFAAANCPLRRLRAAARSHGREAARDGGMAGQLRHPEVCRGKLSRKGKTNVIAGPCRAHPSRPGRFQGNHCASHVDPSRPVTSLQAHPTRLPASISRIMRSR